MNTLFVLLKGLPLTYARDLQEDKEPLFDSLAQVNLSLSVFKDVMDTLKVNDGKMRAGIESGLYATDVADYLAKKGLPFRECHRVAANIVKDCIVEKKDLMALTLVQLKAYSSLFENDVFACFDPMTSINKRNTTGGTGIESVKEQFRKLDRRITTSTA